VVPVPQVFVAGSGPLADDCQREATRLGVPLVIAGFLQPRRLIDAYGAADVLALASRSETWGLVVNEALASGVPVVVSDGVGAAPDLVGADTGRTFRSGAVEELAAAVQQVLDRQAQGHDFGPACRARSRQHSFEAATAGLVAAARRLRHRRDTSQRRRAGVSVVACCGGMVTAGGLERMTFEVLDVARRRGADVHCIVNRWGSAGIVDLADRIGATWSTGYYWYRLDRRVWQPKVAARMAWDSLRTSAGLLRDARRRRATAVLVPDHTTLLRNLPALLLLRAGGVRIVHRLGTAPETGAGYRRLWRWAIAPVPDLLVCNSPFTARELAAHGVPSRKVRIIPNVLPDARRPVGPSAPVPGRLVFAGQVIPGKGLHLLVDAMALLVDRGHDVSLEVAGEIDGWESPTWAGYHARLRARIAALGLESRIRFLGWVDDVPAVLASAWVVVVPSLPEIREGFGLVVLEAKAAGVPVVVGPSGALPDLIDHRHDGWLAAAASAEAFAEGIGWWLDPGRRAVGGAASRASLARFSHEAFAAAWGPVLGVDDEAEVVMRAAS
jgi:glycosyltransferase involved in cell wall biosynthesis